jgi:hypothetical protein
MLRHQLLQRDDVGPVGVEEQASVAVVVADVADVHEARTGPRRLLLMLRHHDAVAEGEEAVRGFVVAGVDDVDIHTRLMRQRLLHLLLFPQHGHDVRQVEAEEVQLVVGGVDDVHTLPMQRHLKQRRPTLQRHDGCLQVISIVDKERYVVRHITVRPLNLV